MLSSWFFALLSILRLFFLLKCPFWAWYSCTLADNFWQSEPYKLHVWVTAAKSPSCWHVLTGPKVIIFRTPSTQHISPKLKNLHWPLLWFKDLPDTLVLLCFPLFHPTFPSVWAFSCSTVWLWTFQTGSPHVVSYIVLLLWRLFPFFCHVLPLFWNVYLVDWIIFTKHYNTRLRLVTVPNKCTT